MADQEQAAQIDQIKADTLRQVGEEYDKLDTNGDGNVDRNELIEIARAKGEQHNVSAENLDSFFNTFDANNDGKVSRQEWLDFFARMFDEQMAANIGQ